MAEHRSIWSCSICGGPIYGDAHVHGLCADKIVAERDALRQQLAEVESWAKLAEATVDQERINHQRHVGVLEQQLAECRQQLELRVERDNEAKAELRAWRGCPACMEDHPEGTTCPPHEARVTGQAWRQRQTRQWAERARIAEQELASANAARERAEAKAGVLRAEMEKIAASTAGDDEPGDRSPRRAGWECVQVARTALASGAGEKERVEAWAAVLRAELKRISDLARQGDIVERGVLGDIADAVLASGAGEKAAAVLEAGRRLLAARSWDVMGEEFLALKAAFDTLDADHG